MKKLIPFLLVAFSLHGQAPYMAEIWRIMPDTICQGDTIRLNYKIYPAPLGSDTTKFYVKSGPGQYTLIATFLQTFLAAQPKETWPALNPGDSCHVIKIPVPLSQAPGSYTLFTNNPNVSGIDGLNKLHVNYCPCSITSSFSIANSGFTYTFTSTSIGTETNTVYSWDLGSGFQVGQPSVSATFSAPGTYTIYHSVTNPTCTDTSSAVITLTVELPTGVTENSQESLRPVYFDLYGNVVEPTPGVLLIRQVGTIRKKVIIQ